MSKPSEPFTSPDKVRCPKCGTIKELPKHYTQGGREVSVACEGCLSLFTVTANVTWTSPPMASGEPAPGEAEGA